MAVVVSMLPMIPCFYRLACSYVRQRRLISP
nr:MAG TPA: hypothetical protein [Caudoviricetes sp.]